MTTLGSDVLDLREMDSTRLVSLCAANQHDTELWTEFLRRFGPRIKNFLRATLRQYRTGDSDTFESATTVDSNQASDLFQNVILRMVQNNCAALKRFSGTTESELLIYFAVIARSTVRDSMRRQLARRRFRLVAPPVRHGTESDESCVIREPRADNEIERGILAREIDCLSSKAVQNSSDVSDRDKLIFRLYYYENLSATQISCCKGIGLSKTGIEKIISRLRDRVRRAAGVYPIEARS